MGSKKLKNGKLSSETLPAYLRNSTSSTKTKTSISAAWSNPLNVENGENSQTNGSRNNTSRTAVPVLPSPILSQKLFSKNALGEKSGEESFYTYFLTNSQVRFREKILYGQIL